MNAFWQKSEGHLMGAWEFVGGRKHRRFCVCCSRPFQQVIPKIVCLCGSTRFWKQFQESGLQETLAGGIVLFIGVARCRDDDDKSFGGYVPTDQYDAIKKELDELHLRKIDLADEVLILNVGGYIGESTRRELEYARANDKVIRFLEPEAST